MAQHPAVHHDDQRPRRHRRFGRRRRGTAPGLSLLFGPFAGPLHLLMNDGIIHYHTPLGRHGRRLRVGSGRRGGEAQLFRKTGRDFLVRGQPPRQLLRTQPLLRLGRAAIAHGQAHLPQFSAQGQRAALALAQGGKPRRSGRRGLAGDGPVLDGLIPGIRPPLPVPSRPASATPPLSVFFSWQYLLSLSAGEEPLPLKCNNSVKMHPAGCISHLRAGASMIKFQHCD